MSKLWLIGLAASAAWTFPAMAQPAPPSPPPMAHGAHAPAPPMMHQGMRHPMPGPGVHHPMPGAGPMPGFPRIGRGGMLPPHFRTPQFFVQDWGAFGFPAPMPGGHWVRYYDDALLIDRDGRVMDSRHDWDWEGGGDRMAHHEDHDGDRDHGGDDGGDDEWADDGHGRGHHGDRMVRVYRHDGPPPGDYRRGGKRKFHRRLPFAPAYSGYGYGYGYGYGAGCGCGGVVITETTTTTAPVVETRTYYETVVERPARRHYAKPVYRKPVPRKPVMVKQAPSPGERG